jgi:acyl-CoA thioester hydrolase
MKPLLFSHRLEVRFRDCDPMGHVNNAVYLTYLEQARFAHWRTIDDGGAAPGVILARVEIDYRKPANYGDVLEIRIFLERIGNTSITYAYELLDQSGGLVAEAKSVLVSYDYAAGRPVAVPGDVRARLVGRPPS